MKNKAKFIESYPDGEGNMCLVYEYRQRQYEVYDYGWKTIPNSSMTLKWQHQDKQNQIDEDIKKEEIIKSRGEVLLPTADECLDAMMDYFEGNEDAFDELDKKYSELNHQEDRRL